jgi:murein DD-endopeptidase MepM/ murein hydrolase activator NlpD
MVATFDTSSVEAGGAKAAGAIDHISAAEYRAQQTTAQSKKANEDAARAERDRARAIDAVKSAIDPTYASQKRMNDLLAQARTLAQQGAISERELAAAVNLHAQALRTGATSAGAMKANSTNLAQQIQDITMQASLGVNPFTIFGQQIGQVAFAAKDMGGTFGKLAGFLSTGWGSVIVGAITVLGLFGTSLLARKKEAKDLGDALDFERMSTEALTKAIHDQLVEARKSVDLSYAAAKATRDTAAANLEHATSVRVDTKALLDRYEAQLRLPIAGNTAAAQAAASIAGTLDEQTKNQAGLEEILRLKEIPLARREAEAATDAAAAATLKYEKAERDLAEQVRTGQLSTAGYTQLLENLITTRDREIKAARDATRAQRDANKEHERAIQLSTFDLPFSRASITSGFGKRARPTEGASTYHQGVDFAQPFGTRVPVAQVGVVEAIGFNSGLGKYVVVDHGGGTKTRYGHLSGIDVAEGQQLERGQTIGRVGSTGISTGPHLHFEVMVNGKRVDPTKGKFPLDDVAVAEAADKAETRLKEFGDRASESIARVSSAFDAQPRLIDQAASATRELDKVIADLEQRKPINWERMVAEAEAAKGAIADALLKPFEDVLEASRKRQVVDELIAANREDEANALQLIWQLEEKLGPLSSARRQSILDMVKAERQHTEELARQREMTDAYLDATRSARQEVEAIIAGTGKLANLGTIFKNLKARVLTEQLFGPVFRDLEKYVKEETAISSSVDIMTSETERAGAAAGAFADTLNEATSAIANGPALNPTATGGSAFEQAFGGFFGNASAPAPAAQPDTPSADGNIIVTALKGSAGGLSPERYFDEMSRRLTRPLLDGLDKLLGTHFFSGLQGVVSGGLGGLMTGGATGGILGALNGIKGLPEGLSKALGGALKGSQTGTMVAGIGNALGLGLSSTGSQLGGALGGALSFLGPAGPIVGALAGGLLGKLISGTAKGSATITSATGGLAGTMGKGAQLQAATGLAGSVQQSIAQIAQALDAQLGGFAVSVGQRDKNFTVDPTGSGQTKASFVRNFGTDQAAALAFAISDAIADGAIKGISPAVAAALKSSTDIDAAVKEALRVKALEKELAGLADPLAGLFDDVVAKAKDRIDLARKYGLDLAKVEQLNAKERKDVLDKALEQQVGSLKSLLNDLSFGSLFEGTPAEKRKRLLSEIADARHDVGAGAAGATDRLADLERQLVETTRASFGTAGGEYAGDRAQAMTTAQQIIDSETKRLEEAAAKADQALGLQNETNDLLAGVNGRLDTLIQQAGGAANLAVANPADLALYKYSMLGADRGVEVAF